MRKGEEERGEDRRVRERRDRERRVGERRGEEKMGRVIIKVVPTVRQPLIIEEGRRGENGCCNIHVSY